MPAQTQSPLDRGSVPFVSAGPMESGSLSSEALAKHDGGSSGFRAASCGTAVGFCEAGPLAWRRMDEFCWIASALHVSQ